MPLNLQKNYKTSPQAVVDGLAKAGLIIGHSPQLSKDPVITAIAADSRKASSQTAFVAYQGVTTDLHEFIPKVSKTGCPLIIGERPPADVGHPASYLQVIDARRAWALANGTLFGYPQEHLKIAAISGTNGKTSTVWMIRELLRAAGHRSLAIGTLGAYIGDDFYPTTHTTPDPPEFYAFLAKAVEDGVKYCALEASSHAAVQGKLQPLVFDYFAITSFSRDHLDFHKTEAAYWQAKWSYVESNCSQSTRVALGPSAWAHHKLAPEQSDFWFYGPSLPEGKELPAQTLRYTTTSSATSLSCLTVDRQLTDRHHRDTGEIGLFGGFALENFSAALLAFEKLTGQWANTKIWSTVCPVPGRLELVTVPNCPGPTVLVDYAHTPDALEKVLQTVKEESRAPARIWVVFGCGGDRDQGKRPLMARAAETYGDRVIVTSDNPRTEDPDKIIADILSGFQKPALVLTEPDRAKAITTALHHAAPEDFVVIAGKGHETYQIIGTKDHPFDDREEARKALRNRLS